MSHYRSSTLDRRRVRRRRGILLLIVAAAVVAAVVVCLSLVLTPGDPGDGANAASTPSHAVETTRPQPTESASPSPVTPVFDKSAQSIDDPTSLWVVVDKRRSLNPVDYVPPDLVYPDVRYVNRQPMRQATADALVAMFAAGGQEAGLQFQVQSAYRSYDSQVRVYDGWVSELGQDAADLTSARPGTSEHQTGLAVDISAVPNVCPVEKCFASTSQAKWLAANAWRFGFILRYPADKTPITGYEYEPYHFRYVGPELAAEMHKTGVTTLEEFFGLPAAPDYP